MNGRVRSVSSHRRAPLDARWTLCATPPGTVETPAQLTQAVALNWLPIAGPDTVAGALRGIGQWSLDTASERLDAQDWWFRARFGAPPEPGTPDRRLAFAGLAGECCVWLNGVELLRSDNMHLAHECAMPSLLEGENELLMRFASLDARLAQRRARPRWRAPMIEHQQLRWARVSLLGRTHGWSPAAPAIGPWRGVEWIERRDLTITDLRMRTELESGVGRMTLDVALAPLREGRAIDGVTLRITRDGVAHEAEAARADGIDGRYVAVLDIPCAAPWWPHTHGEPALYEVQLAIYLAGEACTVTVDLGRVGFRTLAVETADGDFALHVNGVRIFCRGANWTPLDVVNPAAPAGATHAALAQMAAAGLNMVRVNGCMVYEDAAFYEACDALGLLVWQDFMFANMDYPADDPGFAASAQEEARQQLARWQAHPSLAILCGNSEAEQQAAMWGSPRETWAQPLFHETIAALARDLCPGVTYWPSSAHGGAFPHQNDVGTTSYYGVGAYLRPLEDARRADPRFASECLAFANIPPPATLARMPGGGALRASHPGWKARVPRDLGAGWDFEDVRDHYLRRLYGVDPVALRSTDHERYLQLSRAVAAEVMQATMSEWRQPASRCRGALVWFLRDLWAGPGWGLLDERGVPKAAFHGLRRACAPIHLFLTEEGTNGLAVHVVNDPAAPLAGSVEVALYREDGRLLRSGSREIAVSAHSGESWAIGWWFDTFVDASRAYRFGPAEFASVAATLRDEGGRVLDRAFHFPEGLPADRRHDVGLRIDAAAALATGDIAVSISTERFAQSVHVEAAGFHPEDDHFHLAPGEAREVRLVPTPDRTGSRTRITALALNAWSGATMEATP